MRLPFSLLICALLSSPVCGEEVVDSICAVVDEDIILESEINYGISTLLLERKIAYPTSELLSELRQQVLEAFIIQKILLARAVEETLLVEDRVVDRELERRLEALIQQVGSEQKLTEYYGRPLRQIKREMRQAVRDGLLIDRLKMQRLNAVHVRRGEVIEFYREFQEALPKLPERVDLSHILLRIEPSDDACRQARERTDQIHRLLMAGADFDSLARTHSEDPTAENGGRIGFTNRNDLVPEYEEVAYRLSSGEISEVIQTRYGFHIIRLIERQGERISTQHILIKLTPTDEDRNRVYRMASELREKIISSGSDTLVRPARTGVSGLPSFADYAREYSDDSETATDGGRLDQLSLSQLPAEARNIINSLRIGEISQPFETAFGLHIFKLLDRLPERALSPSEDWQTIEGYALNYKREQLFMQWVESLKADHYIWP